MRANRPKYFFNPNAAPEVLYPLVQLLIALGSDVAVWQPDKNLIEEHSNPSWWLGVLTDPQFQNRLQIMSAQWKVDSYQNDRLSSSIRRRITIDPKMNIRSDAFKETAQAVSAALWTGLDDRKLEELEAELLLMQKEIDLTSDDLSTGMKRRSKEVKMSELWTLFDSVIQDLFMVVVSGADFPLCKRERWSAYSKTVNSVQELETNQVDENDNVLGIRIADELTRIIEDSKITFDGEIEYFDERANWFSFKHDLKKMNLPEFVHRLPDIQKEISMFSAYEKGAMSAPFLNGDLSRRSQQIITAIRARRKSFINTIDVLSKGSDLLESHVQPHVPAHYQFIIAFLSGATKISGLFFSLPSVSRIIDGMIGVRYKGLDTRIVIRNLAYWEEICKDN